MSDVEIADMLLQLGPFANTPANIRWADQHPDAMREAADRYWKRMAEIPPVAKYLPVEFGVSCD